MKAEYISKQASSEKAECASLLLVPSIPFSLSLFLSRALIAGGKEACVDRRNERRVREREREREREIEQRKRITRTLYAGKREKERERERERKLEITNLCVRIYSSTYMSSVIGKARRVDITRIGVDTNVEKRARR